MHANRGCTRLLEVLVLYKASVGERREAVEVGIGWDGVVGMAR